MLTKVGLAAVNALLMLAFFVLPLVQPSLSQAQPVAETSFDPKALGEFLDHFFAERMEKLHIPGAVFVWVKDGRIALARGYG